MSFSGKTVLITGAAGNLGRAVAHAFHGQGAALALVDLEEDALRQAYGNTGAKRGFFAGDLLQLAHAARVATSAVERFGRIDVLCNIAGGFRMGHSVHETPQADWDFLFGLNVRTAVNMSQAVVPHMLAAGGGKIVNVGAFAAQKGVAQMGAYVASKSAVIRLTEAMAAELREQNVNVNCVLPTILDTPANRGAMPDADPAKWVAPEDLANVIAFLASDAARAIHGAAVPVAGLS